MCQIEIKIEEGNLCVVVEQSTPKVKLIALN